jgi:N-acetylglutamate synthase-like GNAT family acetyltransferase
METKKDFSVRRASVDDAAQILQCLQETFAPYRDSYTPAAFADTVLTPKTLRKRSLEMQVLVATDSSGRVVGTVAYKAENREGRIRGMAVRPGWQGTGVAARLLEQAEADLRGLHCGAITLDTTRPLQRAMHFYKAHGFRATGEVASFFGMDLLAYRKEL